MEKRDGVQAPTEKEGGGMIIFNGIKTRNGGYFLLFKNEKDSEVEVPVDEKVARHVMLHLQPLSPPKKVEDEPVTPSP